MDIGTMDPRAERLRRLADLALLLGLALVILGALGYIGARLEPTAAGVMLLVATLLITGGAVVERRG